MNEPRRISPNQIRSGPIRHETLSPELLEQIGAVYDVIGPYLDANLEKFELNFMRDLHPESEVAIWFGITAAWIAYHGEHLNDELLPDDEERQLLESLLAISMGVTDVAKMKVSEEVGRRLLQCYDDLGQEDEE